MEQTNYDAILKLIHNRDEADSLIESIDALVASFYQTHTTSLQEKVDSLFSKNIASMIMEEFERQKISFDDKEIAKEFFTNLRVIVEKAKVVNLTLAVEPDKNVLEDIRSRMPIQDKNSFFLFDITVKPEIIGGAQIIWAGRYLDFSLKKQIEEWFRKKSSSISIISSTSTTGK